MVGQLNSEVKGAWNSRCSIYPAKRIDGESIGQCTGRRSPRVGSHSTGSAEGLNVERVLHRERQGRCENNQRLKRGLIHGEGFSRYRDRA